MRDRHPRRNTDDIFAKNAKLAVKERILHKALSRSRIIGCTVGDRMLREGLCQDSSVVSTPLAEDDRFFPRTWYPERRVHTMEPARSLPS